MKNDIPKIDFHPQNVENFGFEIVSTDKIAQIRENNTHHSEQPHQLKFYNLIFFTQGHGRHFVDFCWHPVQKNTLVYLAKEQINAFDFSTDLKGFCMVFTESYFVHRFSNFTNDFVFRLFNPQLFSPIVQVPESSDFITYFDLLRKEYESPNTFNFQQVIESLFTILLSKAEQIRQYQHHKIKDTSKIIVFQKFSLLIEKHYAESRNALFYAKKLAITYKHLNIICKELMNKTAKNVIDDFVVLQAKRKMIHTDVKSAELAYAIGFEDPTNFTKYFKKQTGLTPKAFINSIKNN